MDPILESLMLNFRVPASLLQGRDRQLEVGIETLLKLLQDNPTPVFPQVPAYPKR